ncbi:DUF418 domain-containing protein [Dongia sp.]|uniref:DUF418 domain-containing protein n=1 Tax=Dongia sp. TaxID=1977262 RepID=UPI0035AFCA72
MKLPAELQAPSGRDTGSSQISASGERQLFVDALRGFALFGILIVNINAFATPYYGSGVADPHESAASGNFFPYLISLLFETKFYLLFSFLFGYSFTLQVQSAERADKPILPRLLRRQTALWVIGFAHAVLLFHGDILTTYALLGIVLWALRRCRETVLLRLAVGLVIATALFWLGVGILTALDPAQPDEAAAHAAAGAALRAYRGTPTTVVAQHLRDLAQMWVITGLMQAPTALAMFICGLVAGQRRLFAQVAHLRPELRRVLFAGIVIGLPGSALYAYGSVNLMGSAWEVLALSVDLLTSPLLAGAYVAAFLLLCQTPGGRVLAGLLAPAGRTALSNYIAQSLVCAVIFHAWGFRLIGSIPPHALFWLTFAIFAAQLILSHLWMGRFAYGPLEWLLRMVTYFQLLPLRRSHRHEGGQRGSIAR